jgi:hypothetical protein
MSKEFNHNKNSGVSNTEHDLRVELLINRKLDGLLTPDEELELSRALIRTPEYRRILESSERIDGLCAEALSRELGNAPSDVTRIVDRVMARPRREARAQLLWWSAPAAMAACLAWMIVFGNPDTGLSPVAMTPMQIADSAPNSENTASENAAAKNVINNDPSMRLTNGYRPDGFSPDGKFWSDVPNATYKRVLDSGPSVDLRRDTDYLGVMGDDKSVLLIEVDRTRRAVERPRKGYRLAAGDY